MVGNCVCAKAQQEETENLKMPSSARTFAAVIAGCEAAWTFFNAVFKVLIPDRLPVA
ncbi:hypothetical protein [Cryobacterium sp. Hh7]|uniref:hypothetical protein n=1 Tax=Cryobacterium sp. Hh7 TaxID=1259159 RepID=UPI00141BA6B4|nr:hypothetical protein [Cryobacterium sp. Hh7]